MHWAHVFGSLSSEPGELAVCGEQLYVDFAESCCVFCLAEGTAYSLTDDELSLVYIQGFTPRSNYRHSYCWQECHQRDLDVWFICLCRNMACFLFIHLVAFLLITLFPQHKTPFQIFQLQKHFKFYLNSFRLSHRKKLLSSVKFFVCLFGSGYSGPLKGIPHEKFNTTVIPKSYCSPWTEALGDSEELLNALNAQLPQIPLRLEPANYRCFNR